MRLDESDILFIFKDVNISLPDCTISQYLEKTPVAMDIFKYVTNMFALYATDLDHWYTGPEPTTINSLTRILMPYFGEITKPNVDCSRACVVEATMALIKKNILRTTNHVNHCKLYDYIIEQANAPFSQFLKVNTLAFVNIVSEGRNNKWEKSDNQMCDESIDDAMIEAMDRVKSISVESVSMKNGTSEGIPPVTLTLNIPDGAPLNLAEMTKLMKDLVQLTTMNPKVVVVTGGGSRKGNNMPYKLYYDLWDYDNSTALLRSLFPCVSTLSESKGISDRITALTGIIRAFLSNYKSWEQGIFRDHYDGTILGLQYQWLDHDHNSLENVCWAFNILKETGVITTTIPIENFRIINSTDPLVLQLLLSTKITEYILFHENKLSQFLTTGKEF